MVPEVEKNLSALYIAHRGFTTRLGVMFNPSSSDGSGLSLNEDSSLGSTIKFELFDILLRSREYKMA